MRTLRIVGLSLALTALAGVLSACGSRNTTANLAPASDTLLPFSGTRTYTVSNFTGAGFSGATMTVVITSVQGGNTQDNRTRVRLSLSSSDNQFATTAATIAGASPTFIVGTITSADSTVWNVQTTLSTDARQVRLALSSSKGDTFGFGDLTSEDTGTGSNGGSNTGSNGQNASGANLQLSTTSLTFAATETQKTFTIQNAGTGNLTWTAAPQQAFLSADPASGQGAGTVTVTVNRNGLTSGTTHGQVAVVSNGGTLMVNVTVTVP